MNEKWKDAGGNPFQNPREILEKLDELKRFLEDDRARNLEKLNKILKTPLTDLPKIP